MLNILWGIMIVAGAFFAATQGTIGDLGTASLDSAKEAVSLCLTMLGVMGLWMGFMEIAKQAGLIRALAKLLNPLLNLLYEDAKEDEEMRDYLAANMVANMLGLGWAATPLGLKAMVRMKSHLKKGQKKPSNDMCTFLVMNISALHLVPINLIAYRSQYGSANPQAIVGVSLVANLATTVAGILLCLLAKKIKK